MNWSEPWAAVWSERPPYKLGKKQVIEGTVWMVGMAIAVVLHAFTKEDPWPILYRLWMAVPFGIAMPVLIYSTYWVFPGTVSSGPRGIVRESNGSFLIVPWGAIHNFELTTEKKSRVLIVTVMDGSKYRFLVPFNYPEDQIVQELRDNGVRPNYAFKPTAEQALRTDHGASRRGGLTRR